MTSRWDSGTQSQVSAAGFGRRVRGGLAKDGSERQFLCMFCKDFVFIGLSKLGQAGRAGLGCALDWALGWARLVLARPGFGLGRARLGFGLG